MDLKVLIIDDDEGMRIVLKKILQKTEGFELVGEASNGENGLDLVDAKSPHIVFLDIEMPGMGGVECAKKIIENFPKTFIIFATAHEEYMPQAFEVYASDYLIKPFKVERIQSTLARIKETFAKQTYSIIGGSLFNKNALNKLVIKNKEGISFVDCKEIIFVERENRNTLIHTSSEVISTSESLSDLEEKLDPSQFFRSHKSYIINLSAIHKIFPYGRWTYLVKLKGTEKDALLTHEKYELMEGLFGK